MFNSVLIANRGEIAVRIARTATRLGLRTIAVYSDVDAAALHTRVCDEAHAIGPAPPRESYLAIDKLIEVARRSGAACVHPGYGFLSENADFAEACAAAGVVFVGPPPAAIRAMGLKDHAKALMEKAGVPVVPGYHGDQQAPALLKRKAYEIGYPVLIKAVAGGGGKGMRRVDKHAEFEEALAAAKREAGAAFGNARVLIEKYVAAPRHIEIQIVADRAGHVLHLNERDCSLQRRHQKVIEEAPAPGLSEALRAEMGQAAVAAARAVGYQGAGTVEFIADAAAGLRSGGFWFMEMNTRLQVEHPVTEAITGFDLVEWQFRIASGEEIALAQADVPRDGHAVEARLYAEDPDRDFLPSPGRIAVLELPHGEGIRVDAGVAAGLTVPPDYDPMIAKIIAHGENRGEALDRLAAALAATVVVGPKVNTPLLRGLVQHPEFRAGRFDTGFIAKHLPDLLAAPPDGLEAAVLVAVPVLLARERRRIAATAPDPAGWCDPWSADDGFSLGPTRVLPVDVVADGVPQRVTVAWGPDGPRVDAAPGAPLREALLHEAPRRAAPRVIEVDDGVVVVSGGRQRHVALHRHEADLAPAGGDGAVRAPMNGRIIAVLVEPGQAVIRGTRVAVMEAMKMEHALTASRDGVVAEVVAAGVQVAEGAVVVRLTAMP